jgi:hypothetical protein
MHYFVFIGLVIQVISGVVYCRAIASDNATPQRTSWLLWAVSPLVASCIALADGATWSVVPIAAAGLVPLSVLIFAIVKKSGSWKLDALSVVCLALAATAIVLEVLGSSAIAVVATLVLELTATIPTLHKAWSDPESESVAYYCLNCISLASSLFAVHEWTLEQVAFPIFATTLTGTVLIVLIARKLSISMEELEAVA